MEGEAEVSYQWMRAESEDAADDDYKDIDGADEEKYILTTEDVDKWIKVKVTGTGDYKGIVVSENAVGSVEIAITDANLATSDTNVADVEKSVEENKIVSTFAAGSVDTNGKTVRQATLDNLNAQVPGNQDKPGGGVLGVGYVGFQVNAGDTAKTYKSN